MTLRDYQQAAVDSVGVAIKSHKTVLIVAPTASGKSHIIAEIVRRFSSHGLRVLVLVHQSEIIEQNFKACPVEDKGIYCAGLKRKEVSNQVIFASRDSLGVRPNVAGTFDICIIDESHCVSSTDSSRYQKIFSAILPKKIIGLTATPWRLDNGIVYGAKKFWEKLAYDIPMRLLIERGYLSPYTFPKVDKLIDADNVKVSCTGDYKIEELESVSNLPEVTRKAVETWRQHEYKLTLFFCCSVAHATSVQAYLGSDAKIIHAKTPLKERAQIIDDARNGKVKVLVNVATLTTGIDIPIVDCLVLLRATQSASLFVQCLDDQTEILTKRGWVTHKTVIENDTCITFDPCTDQIKDAKIIKIISRETGFKERMYSIESPRQSIRVTEDHRMLMRTSKDRKWQFLTAKECSEYKTAYEIPVSGIRQNKGLDLSDDEIEFIGWAISDGSINKANITISQSKIKYVNEIKELLTRLKMRFGDSVITASSNFKRNHPNHRISVSYAEPRKLTEKHLRGCGYLKKYLDKKNLPFDEFSPRQFDVLINTIIKADGSIVKNPVSKGKPYIQSSFQICKSRSYLDRLQALCVQFGWRADITSNRDNCSILSVSKKATKHLGGNKQTDRKSLKIEECKKSAVWCVENEIGTLITRRNGRVTIMGNCVGRALRIAPGKTVATIYDFAGNFERFLSLEEPLVNLKGMKQKDRQWIEEELAKHGITDTKLEASTKECPSCSERVASARRVCFCGHLFLNHTSDYFDGIAKRYNVDKTQSIHCRTKAGEQCVVVTYHTKEIGVIKEWLFPHARDFRRKKATERLAQLKAGCVQITAKRNQKGYWQVSQIFSTSS